MYTRFTHGVNKNEQNKCIECVIFVFVCTVVTLVGKLCLENPVYSHKHSYLDIMGIKKKKNYLLDLD